MVDLLIDEAAHHRKLVLLVLPCSLSLSLQHLKFQLCLFYIAHHTHRDLVLLLRLVQLLGLRLSFLHCPIHIREKVLLRVVHLLIALLEEYILHQLFNLLLTTLIILAGEALLLERMPKADVLHEWHTFSTAQGHGEASALNEDQTRIPNQV